MVLACERFCRTVRLALKAIRVEGSSPNRQQLPNVMQATVDRQFSNPLSGLISDDVYHILEEHDLLSEKGVRDFQIRKRFRAMRSQNIAAYDAIEQLREEYAYLQFDTIRKIVYRQTRTAEVD